MSDHVEDQSMLKDTPSNFKSRIFPVPRVKMMWSGKAEDLLQHRYVQTQKLHWPLQGNYILFFFAETYCAYESHESCTYFPISHAKETELLHWAGEARRNTGAPGSCRVPK